jgi:hypothetical protein
MDGTQQKIVGPRLQRLPPQASIVESGYDDDRHMGAVGLGTEAPDESGAVQYGHLEVGYAKVRAIARRPVQGFHRV